MSCWTNVSCWTNAVVKQKRVVEQLRVVEHMWVAKQMWVVEQMWVFEQMQLLCKIICLAGIFIFRLIYIFILCLSACLSVCFQKTSKRLIWSGSKFSKLYPKVFDFCKILKMREKDYEMRIFFCYCFILQGTLMVSSKTNSWPISNTQC